MLQKEQNEVVAKCQVMEQQFKEIQHENEKLITKLNALENRVLTQQSLIDDDRKVLYYTGLNIFLFTSSVFFGNQGVARQL